MLGKRFVPRGLKGDVKVLARYSDGELAVIVRSVGKGTAIYFAGQVLDTYWLVCYYKVSEEPARYRLHRLLVEHCGANARSCVREVSLKSLK